MLARLLFANALAALREMTDAITDSGLDWTISRITNPTDKPATESIRAGFLGVDDVGSAMTRADVAAFLVAQLSDTAYVRAAPAISD